MVYLGRGIRGREGRRKKEKEKERRRRKREEGGKKESVILFEMFSGSFMMYPISPSLWKVFAHSDTFPGQTLPPASF